MAIGSRHDVEISGSASSTRLDGDELQAFLAAVEIAAVDTASSGEQHLIAAIDVSVSIRSGGSGIGTFEGPPLTGDMWPKLERRLLEILGHPTTSPYGNPIPGLDELDQEPEENNLSGLTTLDKVVRADSTRVTVVRIGEPIQNDAALMAALRRAGAMPGSTVKVVGSPGGVLVGSAGEYAELDSATAAHVFVAKG